MDKFDKNSFRTVKKGTSDPTTPNMKTEPHFKCCSYQKIHKNMSSIKRKYSDNG